MTKRIPVEIGMQVKLRKPHACGGDSWQVTRTGADVGILCLRCKRRIMLEREEFERRVHSVLDASSSAAREGESAERRL